LERIGFELRNIGKGPPDVRHRGGATNSLRNACCATAVPHVRIG
jgi:hypothetical protein